MVVRLSEAFAPSDKPVSELDDRELLEEIAENQRKLMAVIGGLMQAAAMHPAVNMMLVQQGIMP